MDYNNLESLKQTFPTDWESQGMAGFLQGSQMADYNTDRQMHEYLSSLNSQEETEKMKEFMQSAPTRMAQQELERQKAVYQGQTLPSQTALNIAQNESNKNLIGPAEAEKTAEYAHQVHEMTKTEAWEPIQAMAPYGKMLADLDKNTDLSPEDKEAQKQSILAGMRENVHAQFPQHNLDDKLQGDMAETAAQHALQLTQFQADQVNKENLAKIQRVEPAQLRLIGQQYAADAAKAKAESVAETRAKSATTIQQMKIAADQADPKTMAQIANRQIEGLAQDMMRGDPNLTPDHARVLAGTEVLSSMRTTIQKDGEDKIFAQFASKYIENNVFLQDLMSGKQVDPARATEEWTKMMQMFNEFKRTSGNGTVGTPTPKPMSLPTGISSEGPVKGSGPPNTNALDYKVPSKSGGPMEAANKAATSSRTTNAENDAWQVQGEAEAKAAAEHAGMKYDPDSKYWYNAATKKWKITK